MLKQIIHSPLINPQDVEALAPLVKNLQTGKGIGAMPWFNIPKQKADLAEINIIADIFRQECEHVVLCGTGGSSLGARTLVDLVTHPLGLKQKDTPQLYIVESTEPEIMTALTHDLPSKKTGWIFISKSGNTLETLTQFLVFLEHRRMNGSGPVFVITMPGSRPLRNLAEKYDIQILDHQPELGGRFSLFSAVGLLPAAIAGLDISTLRDGAASMTDSSGINIAVEAACWHMACLRKGFNMQVVMPYAKRLTSWTLWYRQLWAESLGKQGKGSTPIAALGPVDHHSMLQLFLDGPADKCLTALCVEDDSNNATLVLPKENSSYDYLSGHSGLGILNAQAYGTIQSFLNHNLPVRELRLSKLNEQSLGKLLMLGMVETVMTAELLNVDAFDQPAVEESKILAFQQLKGLGLHSLPNNLVH